VLNCIAPLSEEAPAMDPDLNETLELDAMIDLFWEDCDLYAILGVDRDEINAQPDEHRLAA
jgi:hypothetical protein